jgi:hypothetical protein
MYYEVTMRRFPATIFAAENQKARSTKYCERLFVALGIQHAMCQHRIIVSPAACPALQYYSTLSHKRYNKKNLLNTKRVLIFSITLSETFIIRRIIEQDIIKNVY